MHGETITFIMIIIIVVVGIESRWGDEIFRIRPDWPWGPLSLPYSGYRVSFPGLKRTGRGLDHPPPNLAPRLKEEYSSLPLWAFVACQRATFTFIIIILVNFCVAFYIKKLLDVPQTFFECEFFFFRRPNETVELCCGQCF